MLFATVAFSRRLLFARFTGIYVEMKRPGSTVL